MSKTNATASSNATAKEFTVIPATFIIKKVVNNDFEAFFFDIGLYPNARRFYINKNLIDFLLTKDKLSRLNSRMFATNAIQFANVKVNENDTSIVVLGENILNAFILRIKSDSGLISKVKAFLDSQPERLSDNVNVAIADYDILSGSDGNTYITVLTLSSNNVELNIPDIGKIRLTYNGIQTEENQKEESQKKTEKERYNKAGVRILK